MKFRYNAFISYRHSELDMFVAKKIHKGLETFKVPGPVAKASGMKKIKRVFRDQEELPIGSDLGDNITAAIKDTEFLIVICSPRTPQSEWVQKEIESFISFHGRDHILAVLIEGEPGESFPKALLVDDAGNPVEPLAADVRGKSNKEVEKKLKTELLRLAAPILHCNYDDLRQRHRERRNKKILAISGATLAVLAVLGLGFGIYYAHNARVLKKALNDKEINHSKFLASTAMGLLENGDREAAMLVAREALPQKGSDKPFVADALYPLSQSLDAYKLGVYYNYDRVFYCGFRIEDVIYDQTGEYVIAIDAGNYVNVWSISSGKKVAEIDPYVNRLTGHYEPLAADVIDGKLYVLGADAIYQYDLDGNLLNTIQTGIYAPFGKIDGKNKLAACENDRVLYMVDLSEMKVLWSKETENDLFSEYVFDSEGKYLAVSVNADDDEDGGFDLYKVADGSFVHMPTAKGYISHMRFLQNGDLVSISSSNEVTALLNGSGDFCVQYYDVKSGKCKWTYEIPIVPTYSATNNLNLTGRIYKRDENGISKEVNEVIVSANNNIYTIDGNTGELISNTAAFYVSNLLISASSSLAYVPQKTGDIMAMDLRDGSVYDSLSLSTECNIDKAIVSNAIFALVDKSGSRITILSENSGPGKEVILENDESIDTIDYSTDYSKVAVKTYGGQIIFFDGKSGEKISSYEDDDYNTTSAFIDEKTYLVITKAGEFKFIDSKTGKSKVVKSKNDTSASYAAIDSKNGKAYIANYGTLVVVDTKKQKVIIENTSRLDASVVSLATMESFCYRDEDLKLYKIDLKTGNETEVGIEELNSKYDEGSVNRLYLSPSGKYLAVACKDQVIRIYNVETNQIESSVNLYFASVPFVQFSDDESKLFLSGDDQFFKVYDITKKEMVFVGKNQYPILSRVTEAAGDNMYVLTTSRGLYFLDAQSMTLVATAEEGLVYDPMNKFVWSSYNRVLYRFKYMDLDALLEEAERQFPNAALTEEQRIKYFVD